MAASKLQENRKLVQKSTFFHGLTDQQLDKILDAAYISEMPAGSFFFHQGEDALSFFIITEGQVRLSQINVEGQQVIVHIFGPGDGMGIIVALSNTQYPVSAEAMTGATALGWNRDTITGLMEIMPRLAINGMHLLAFRFMELQERYRELATERVERRVARALLRQAQHMNGRSRTDAGWRIPLSRQDLAEMTGTTLYTVSRTCSNWEQQGIVTAGRGFLDILDYHQLVVVAEDLPTDHKCLEPEACLYCAASLNCNS